MRRLCIYTGLIFLILSIAYGAIIIAKDTYEDYRDERDRYHKREYRYSQEDQNVNRSERRDRPLSEIKTGEREDLLDELRDAVRNEIDDSINKERKAGKKNINEKKLIKDVRKIVREEIEDAIKIKEKRYLAPKTVEIGGFISFTTYGLESSEQDINYLLQVYPMVGYFFTANVGLQFKAEAQFNLTTNTQSFNFAVGPQFVFGINKSDTICFYATIILGMSLKTITDLTIGYRFGNEIGLKFVLTNGVILNVGLMIIFDSGGTNVTGFSQSFVPAIGITGWF